MSKELERAKDRIEESGRHRLRNGILLAAVAAVLAVPQTRRWLIEQLMRLRGAAKVSEPASVSEAQADADKPISRMTKDELVARARDEGIEVRDDMTKDEVYEALKSTKQP